MSAAMRAFAAIGLAVALARATSPLDCGFETDFCAFATGDPAWDRSNSTPTTSTGPAFAQEGSRFAYTESTGNGGSTFGLTLASFEGAGVEFYYHM
jgi:hypothetical protein